MSFIDPMIYSPRYKNVFLILSLVFAQGCLKSRPGVLPNSRTQSDAQESPASNSVSPTPVAVNPNQVVEDLKDELRRLATRIEELEGKNRDLTDSSGKKSQELDRLQTKLNDLESVQQELIANLQKKEKELTQTIDIKALLEKAKLSLKKENFEEAIESLSMILNNNRGKNNEEAAYLRGEANFKLGEYKKAILDFGSILENHPKSKRTAQCLYYTAKSFEELNMKSDAKAFYTDLRDRFPKSPEAKKIPKKYLK